MSTARQALPPRTSCWPPPRRAGTDNVRGPRDMYALFGLNEKQISIIKNATPKRQYFYMSPLGNRLFELALGPVALAFVGVSDKESQARIRDLYANFGQQWPNQWLKEKGVAHEHLFAA